jgi:hypothetical protein
MARQRLGRRQRRNRIAERAAHRFQFDDVAHRRRRAVRVEVVDRPTPFPSSPAIAMRMQRTAPSPFGATMSAPSEVTP